MAELDGVGYTDTGAASAGNSMVTRTIRKVVDFSLAGNQLAGATDSLNLFELKAGTNILSAGIKNVSTGVDATNQLTLRVGTTALAAALDADDAAGVMEANANVPYNMLADADVNLLSAVAVRTTGEVEVWVVVSEGAAANRGKLAARDTSTGLA